ncbi:MAG TPA: AraC family transcriptional regulator, partial [Clostridiales bacterium]|nr:AraC family transcriptional regulator [Clostridiales bacterium]
MKEQILAVQRMQDYIEKNQTEEISLSDLARVSLFSPWYSHRLFRDCLGLTPTEYIRKYRLTQAAKILRCGGARVIDVALDVGFSNVDT